MCNGCSRMSNEPFRFDLFPGRWFRVDVSWSRRFATPIKLKDGREIATLADARDFQLALPERHQSRPFWQYAAELLIDAAEPQSCQRRRHGGAAYGRWRPRGCFKVPRSGANTISDLIAPTLVSEPTRAPSFAPRRSERASSWRPIHRDTGGQRHGLRCLLGETPPS